MKEKDILKVIKEDIEKHTPNVLDKIDIRQINIEPAPKAISKRRTINLFSALSMATVALVIGLFTGLLLFKPTQEGPGPSYMRVDQKNLEVAQYAISGANLIGSSNNINTKMMPLSINQSKTMENAHVDEFHKYISIIEEHLNLNKTDIVITKNHEDKDFKYDFKMVVNLKSVIGLKEDYILYYNETVEYDDDEEEKEMEGILKYNNILYVFKSEEEKESGESETKVSIYQKDNKNNRVEIEKEIEKDEYYHRYTMYNNNVKTKITFEAEDGERILEVKHENTETKYYLNIISQGEMRYQISVENDIEFTFELNINKVLKQYIYILDEDQIIKT